MYKSELSAIDAYINRVYRIIVLIIPIFCLCASVTIITLHSVGWYPGINQKLMYAFIASDILYFIIGIYFFKTGFDENNIVKPGKLKMAKYTMVIITIIQWNGISYIWPYTDLWAYTTLFTIVIAFFFDSHLTAFSTVGIVTSMLVSWVIQGDKLLPTRDAYFEANMTLRFVGTTLTLMSINIITYFGGKFFVEELEKYANYDSLTRLLNRKSLGRYLKDLYQKAEEKEIKFSMILIDIDNFKQINDTYGHDCGDKVLKSVADIISLGINPEDKAFRWGGEEILVILQMDGEGAIKVAERLRKQIENNPVSYRNEFDVPVTVTMGLSKYIKGVTVQQMMDDADAKLYHGKHNGKNQVVSKLEGDSSPKS